MKRSSLRARRLTVGVVGLLACGAVAQGLLIGTVEVPVSVALREVVQAVAEPPTLDLGRVDLGETDILQNVHCTVSNVNTSLWAYVVDGPGGWTLGPAPGPDRYCITVNGITMTGEPQKVFPLVMAYGTANVPFRYFAPTSDSFGGGVDQGYALRIEARESTMDPGEEPEVP